MRNVKWFLVGVLISVVMVACSEAIAHEMTPTYPKLRPSFAEDIYTTSIDLFNRRQDVEYYEVGIFDKDFKVVPFTTIYKIVKVSYLSKVNINVYIKAKDVNKAVYICSQSKIRKEQDVRTVVASRICSKFK